jgi:hypothetical protein
LKVALSDKCGFYNILIPETWGASSSLLTAHLAKLSTAIKYSETIPTITLDKLVKRLKLKKIELIKMDIEGSEKRVLEHSQNALAITGGVVVEVHTTVNKPDDIITLLRRHGFMIDHVKRKSTIDVIIFSNNSRARVLLN